MGGEKLLLVSWGDVTRRDEKEVLLTVCLSDSAVALHGLTISAMPPTRGIVNIFHRCGLTLTSQYSCEDQDDVQLIILCAVNLFY